ncbi:MAG: cohesin domain-containing protein [Acidobacteriota bacterium]
MSFICQSRVVIILVISIVLTACGGAGAYKRGRKLEATKDFDQALLSYGEALRKEPRNVEYRLAYERTRFQASLAHFEQGRRLKESGKLEQALAEFQQAAVLDPSNALAQQEVKALERSLEQYRRQQQDEKQRLSEIIEKNRITSEREALGSAGSVSIPALKLTGDLKRAYESIGKVAGINVIFDADVGARPAQASLDLKDVTVQEALNILALQTNTYWSVINKNTIVVATDNQQSRQKYEEQVVKTFYLGNSLTQQDLTETITMLRLIVKSQNIAPITAQNAVVMRDTPDKIAIAEKILQSIDKSKPEVLIEVSVIEVNRGFTRNLGTVFPTASAVTFSKPPGGTSNSVSIKDLDRIGSGNFSITIPSTSLEAFITQTNGKVLQNPTLRASDGKVAKLRVGTRQPVAQGSFQPTFAGNIGGTPVVNFQYIDVGVNLDITPRVLLNRDVAMNTKVEVTGISGTVTFGGADNRIEQPILTLRSVEHDIRLKEGESNLLGGIIQDTDTVTLSGVPGLHKVPLLRYLFSREVRTKSETEVIIVITPHIVRLPEYMDDDFGAIAILGAGNNPRYLGQPVELSAEKLAGKPASGQAPLGPSPSAAAPPGVAPTPSTRPDQPAPRLAVVKLIPSSTETAVGSRLSVMASIENAQGAYALSFNIAFDPKVLRLVEVQNGGFLSSDGKMVAVAPRIENEAGRAVISMARPPESSGLDGSGSLVNFLFEAAGPGTSAITFTQANLRDAGQNTLPASFASTQVTVK